MKKILILFSLMLSFSVQATEVKNECSAMLSADEQMDCLFTQWKKETTQKMQEQCKKQGIALTDDSCIFENVFVWAEESLSILANDSNWIEARMRAYSDAVAKARAEIAIELGRKMAVEKVITLVDDQELLTNEDLKEDHNQKDLNAYERIFDKTLQVTEGKLDNKLKELGISPEEYKKASPSKKKDLLRNKTVEKSILEAVEETVGMIPVHSFEVVDKKGETVIRVVVSKSMERIGAIKAFLRDGKDVSPNPNKKSDKTVGEQVILPAEEMMKLNGVRWVYDQEGYPVIVAFGQATYQDTDSLVVKKVRKNAAVDRANQNASEEISRLLNLTTSVQRTLKEMADEYQRHEKTDAFDKITSGATFSHDLESIIKEYSSNNTSGDRAIHQWTYKHPYLKDHYIVGVVRILSPQTSASAHKIKNVKAAPRTPVAPKDNNKNTAAQKQDPQSLESFSGVYIPKELDDYDF